MTQAAVSDEAVTRVAIVTGAGSGIGRATAELFVERGVAVVASDIDAAALGWCAGPLVVGCAGDVADAAHHAALVATALDLWGRLDVSILNAGVSGSSPFEADGAIERFERSVAVNVTGVALGIRHAAPAMRASGGGAIVATASTSAFGGDPGRWAYNATKAAVVNLVRAAAIDYAVQGIRVNAVAPGPVLTGMTTRLTERPEVAAAMARRIPLQRWGVPRELAEAMWFLASPAASFITGVTLPVDGGLSAGAGHFDLPALP